MSTALGAPNMDAPCVCGYHGRPGTSVGRVWCPRCDGASPQLLAAVEQNTREGRRLTVRQPRLRASRNDPCPCGSGRKFKRCHGR